MNMNIRKSQGGFTLIELVIVIVILGILAAVAVPRFVDLSGEAAQAAVNGQAGALASASAINFAACVAGNAACDDTIEDCVGIEGLMTAFDTARYNVTGSLDGDFGNSSTCTVTDSVNGPSATFEGIRTAQYRQ